MTSVVFLLMAYFWETISRLDKGPVQNNVLMGTWGALGYILFLKHCSKLMYWGTSTSPLSMLIRMGPWLNKGPIYCNSLRGTWGNTTEGNLLRRMRPNIEGTYNLLTQLLGGTLGIQTLISNLLKAPAGSTSVDHDTLPLAKSRCYTPSISFASKKKLIIIWRNKNEPNTRF